MIREITKKLKSIALLEAIISPEWEYRYYSYNSNWGEGEEMASMRDGSGNKWFLWVKNDLAALKVMSRELDTLNDIETIKNHFPTTYASFISEPAFSINESTSLWYLNETEWVKFDVNKKETERLINVFEFNSAQYKEWAEGYYEIDLSLDAIEKIMSGDCSENVVRLLNAELSYKGLEIEINEIGYNR